MKFLLWGAIVLIVMLWMLHGKKARLKAQAARPGARAALPEPESMMRCQRCGVYFPASEAVVGQAGAVFCSDEHRRRHAAG